MKEKSMETALVILTAVSGLIKLANDIAAGARERGENTPEQDAAFDKLMEETGMRNYWQRND